jgi:hypothetical protein
MPSSLTSILLLLILLTPSLTIAQEAPAASSSSKARQKSEQHVRPSRPGPETGEGVYHNANFGFTYKPPYGWVDRTRQMQDENNDPSKSQLLLAIFERPPEATGDSVNSAVIIAAESVNSYPGLKSAVDYMGPLTELTTAKGFKVTHEPYEYLVGAKPMVRGDFVKDLGKLTMHQSSLVLLQKGFIVSFTFIGGNEDEVEELIEKLSANSSRPR